MNNIFKSKVKSSHLLIESLTKRFNKQIDDLYSRDFDEEIWVYTTSEIASEAFGKESSQVIRIHGLQFTKRISEFWHESDSRPTRDEKEFAKKMLRQFIDKLERDGVFDSKNHSKNEKKVNFLSDKKDSELLAYLLPAAIVIFSTGFYLGGYFSKIEYQDIKLENKALRDSLLLTKPLSKNAYNTSNDHSKAENSYNN